MKREEGVQSPLGPSRRLALVDLVDALSSGRAQAERLNRALAIVTRALDAASGALFVRAEDGHLALAASCGLSPEAPQVLERAGPFDETTILAPGHEANGLAVLCPIRRRDHPMAVLGLGPRRRGRSYGEAERAFLRSVVACLAAGIDNARLSAELRRVHQKRSIDLVQLHDLLDISRELGGAAEEGEVHDVVVRAALGHFVVQRCGLFLLGAQGLALAHGRGLPSLRAGAPVPPEEARAGLQGLLAPTPVADLPEGALRQSLARSRLVLAVPLAEQAGTAPHPIGVLAIGDRASGSRYTEEDCVFAQALARLAASAVGNVRLRRLREEKQRQDRELQVAREIQRSLFPARAPDLPGFAVAAVSRPCHEVGGDSYDWIALGRDRLALVVADVSGKGTPASLVMASVHAFVRAVAGTAPPVELVERLNRFLFASARSGRFVTLFYAELDGRAGRLTYVRAGHVPPFVLGCDGVLTRLVEGGPALGLLEAARYEAGEATLRAGDVVAMVTDGVTEAASPDDREFGDERVAESLARLCGRAASVIVDGLVAAVDAWQDAASLGDDLTVLVLEARAQPASTRSTSS